VIGFVGLGAMGEPMARRLVAAGFDVRVYDVRPEQTLALAAAGATVASSAAEAVRSAGFGITMLPDTPDVSQALRGTDGILGVLRAGQVFVDMSTISPIATREMAREVAQTGALALDAPVSGGISGAETGMLSIMVGGSREAFERAAPILETLGTTITYLGESGSGQAAKLCNQVVVAMNIQAMCEGLSLGRGLGLDLGALRQVLAGGAAGSWMMDNLAPKILKGDASAGFRIDLQLKDLRLALEASQSEGIPLPGAALSTSLYVEARAHGEGGNGNQALFRVYERLTNRTLGPATVAPHAGDSEARG
jgi:2-hydroxy-3-oxopropionate reductase